MDEARDAAFTSRSVCVAGTAWRRGGRSDRSYCHGCHRLASLIGDGPLAGITGRNGGINPDGDIQRDIDVAADELMRRALRNAPVAAILSEEAALPETLNAEAPLCVAFDPLDGSANLENQLSRSAAFFRSDPGATTFFRPSSSLARRNVPRASSFTVRRLRSFWRSAGVSISSSSTGARGNSC